MSSSQLKAKGFVINNDHSKQNIMIEAVIEALVEAVTTDAQVIDPGGLAPGLWKIK